MATLDYQAQLTAIYNDLTDLDEQISKLALRSEMNTIQISTMASLTTIASNLDTIERDVESLQRSMTSLLAELRSK